MGLRFTEEPTTAVYEFEKMTWDEMDEVFYTDEEIGDFRYSAFMINCGLEEEDWSTPDVEPVPWPKEVDEMKIKNFATNRTELKENQLKAKRQSQLFDLATKGDSTSVTTSSSTTDLVEAEDDAEIKGLENAKQVLPEAEAGATDPVKVEPPSSENPGTEDKSQEEVDPETAKAADSMGSIEDDLNPVATDTKPMEEEEPKEQDSYTTPVVKGRKKSDPLNQVSSPLVTPGSGGKPRLRPRTLVSPRRSRNSKADLYSPEVSEAKQSVKVDSLQLHPPLEESECEKNIENSDSSTSNSMEADNAEPGTPGSGGKPRFRPQTLVSPRRTRNSKANLYSPEITKPTLSIDADTLAVGPLPEEAESDHAIENGDSTTSNPVDDAETKPRNEEISEPKQGIKNPDALLDTFSHSVLSTASTIDSFELTPPSSAKTTTTPTTVPTSPLANVNKKNVVKENQSPASPFRRSYSMGFQNKEKTSPEHIVKSIESPAKSQAQSPVISVAPYAAPFSGDCGTPRTPERRFPRANSMSNGTTPSRPTLQSERSERSLMRTNSGSSSVKRKSRKKDKDGNEELPRKPMRRTEKGDNEDSTSSTGLDDVHPTEALCDSIQLEVASPPKSKKKKKRSSSVAKQSNVRELPKEQSLKRTGSKKKRSSKSTGSSKTSQSPSHKKPSLKRADSVPVNGAKSKKKRASVKRPASLRVLENIDASVSPARRPRRGAKKQDSLRLMSNNDSSMSEVTADLPKDKKPSNKSKSSMYGSTSELTADPHEDENDGEQPKSSNSSTRKSIIGTTKTQTRRFSRSLSSRSQSMLSSITNKFKTGSKAKSDGQKKLKQKEVPTSSGPSGFSFSDLPTEVKQRVALFLPIGDVMNLVATTKAMRSELNLDEISSPLTDRDSQNKVYCTGMGTKCIVALVPNPLSSLHTIRFTCDVRVGLRPFCKVWVVEQNLPVDQAPENLERLVFHAGKVIAKTPSLDRDSESLALTFRVKPGKMYQFYARSRIHLHLDNMTLQRICFNAKTFDYIAYQFDAMLKP